MRMQMWISRRSPKTKQPKPQPMQTQLLQRPTGTIADF